MYLLQNIIIPIIMWILCKYKQMLDIKNWL